MKGLYNTTSEDELELRKEILQKLFKFVGEDVWIEPDFRCEFGKNILLGIMFISTLDASF